MPSKMSLCYPTDIVVAVMGVTGTGKSSFIRLVTGNNKIKVGKRLQSETNTVSTYRFSHHGVNFVLVDTPGFDDTSVPDEKVLETITTWLTESYREGTAQRNFSVFLRLCGPQFTKQVILGTTFWRALRHDAQGEAIGEQRLGELLAEEGYWGPMICRGSEAVKVPDDMVGARKLLMKFAGMNRSVLQVQDEVVNQNLDSSTTSAAKALCDERCEQEKAAIEREKRMTNDLHQLQLEMIESKRKEAAQKAEFDEKIKALERKLAKSDLEQERRLSEQAARMQKDMLDQERAKTAALARQNEEHQRRNRLIMERQTRDNACRLLINQLHMAQVNGSVKCAVKSNGGKDVAKCAHCNQMFRGFGMYKCGLCRGSHYNVCDPCHGKGKRCLNKSHELVWRDAVPFNVPLKLGTGQDRGPSCDRCNQPVLELYLYCAECRNGDWDMCIDCATTGNKCDGWWWQGHQLSIHTRH